MSVPPQGGWQDPGVPPNGGQPYGQQFNPTGYGAQQPPPPGWQQGTWPQQPTPPPNKGNSLKWLLIAVAVLLVIGISVGATLIFTRGGGGGGSTSTSGAPSEFASAGDTGPVSVITEEPTCTALSGINSALADVEANGWSAQRGNLGPAASWSAQQRAQVEAVGTAMKNASDQTAALAKATPHRVVRELYEQFIAYGRAYAESIPNYVPSDDALASVNVSAGSAMLGICNAIQYASASRSLAVAQVAPRTNVSKLSGPDDPGRFLITSSPSCTAWVQRESKFIADTAEWATLDTKLTIADWTPEEREIQQQVLPVLQSMATDMQTQGRASGNPTLEDFAVLGGIYYEAYISAGDDYRGADSWLSYAASRLNNVISAACRAVAG